jgi:uncharacterized protein YjbI with pentapeptide repeats
MDKEKLEEVLEAHKKWLHGDEDGEQANLRGADLRGVELCGADLRGANLRGADLRGVDLTEANLRWANLGGGLLRKADLHEANLHRALLRKADLAEANLTGVDLTGADLAGANLRGALLCKANLRWAELAKADLTGAVLSDTVLQAESAWEWVLTHRCQLRSVGGRTLVLGARTRHSPYMGGADYAVGKLYQAPYFSACPVTPCHPGLYVAGGPDEVQEEARLLVAFWLDEAVVAGGKCRVPRFRTVGSVEEFEGLEASDLDGQSPFSNGGKR